ncbi:8-oxo-dGTP diphosphatase [Litoreibacter halocynthiae]|uniref:8-oxo-dGTP diphosphatase n=1 Tax=Litoreibacter halocynthiae TaxID=1242689 RepID=A0A4V3EVM7_9RHOB|nr:NUDIX hydrolase [Litoreibacter halocynthiae]TDT73715.1 8-oxo-dGTP diphosphatase [Litoreibacter halocynthiae]
MIRRFGEPFQSGKPYRLRPGAYAILWNGEELLTTMQDGDDPEIQLPGGGIDPGEHPIPALHREVMEETGWAMASPRKLGAFRRFVYMPEYGYWAEKLCSVYIARPVLQRSPPIEPDHSAVWMSPADAARLLGNEGDRHFVRQLFAL